MHQDFYYKQYSAGALKTVPKDVNEAGSRGSEARGVLVDFTDQALLALEISRVKLPPGFFADGNPIEDGELLPVDGIGIEGSKGNSERCEKMSETLVELWKMQISDL